MRITWTLREEQLLRKYYRREKTRGIQKRMRYRTRYSIRSKAYRMGMRYRKLIRWSSQELKILDQFYPIEGIDCLKRLPNQRSKQAVRIMALKRHLVEPKWWSLEEDAILLQYDLSEGPDCYKRLSNRTRGAAKSRARLIGLTAEKQPLWFQEENDILKNNSDLNVRALQKQLPHRTQCAIGTRKQRLEARDKSSTEKAKPISWLAEEEAILRQYYPVGGLECQKRLPNRSKPSVTKRAIALGLFKSPFWTDEEIDILKENCHLSLQVLQTVLPNRSKASILFQRKRLERFGVLKAPEQKRIQYWSEEEKAILQQYYPIEGLNCQKRLPINRSGKAIRYQAAMMGIHRIKKTPWSEEENEIIKKHCGLKMARLQKLAKLQKRLPGRTQQAIEKQMKHLETCGELTIPKHNVHWKEKEDAILRQYYLTNIPECRKRMPDRTASAIQHRAVRLGLIHQNSWTEAEIDTLKENRNLGIKALQKLLPNRTKHGIYLQINRLKKRGELLIESKWYWNFEEDAILLRYYPIEGLECEKRIPNRSRSAVQVRVQRFRLLVK